MIVLDTNVLSELMKPSPERRVEHWLAAQSTPSVFVSSITQAEILYGIAVLPAGRRRSHLLMLARSMFEVDFAGRVLSFDRDAADAFAAIASERRRAGMTITPFDAQIAAIARSRGAALATRNVRDFEGCGVKLINPWEHG